MSAERAARYGRDLVVIDRSSPTSRTCSNCGRVDGPTPLPARGWERPAERCATATPRKTSSPPDGRRGETPVETGQDPAPGRRSPKQEAAEPR
nr:transposase [Actinopolyspora biskrensis]